MKKVMEIRKAALTSKVSKARNFYDFKLRALKTFACECHLSYLRDFLHVVLPIYVTKRVTNTHKHTQGFDLFSFNFLSSKDFSLKDIFSLRFSIPLTICSPKDLFLPRIVFTKNLFP